MLEKKLRFTQSAANALVVFHKSKISVIFFGSGSDSVEAEGVCKYTASTFLVKI